MALSRLFLINKTGFLQNGFLIAPILTAYLRTAGSLAEGGAKDKGKEPLRKPKTPQGKFDTDDKDSKTSNVYQKFPDDVNPNTKEKGGPAGPEPTRYGDWERKGRCIDF